jgi:energy-coupling factor transporter ATP-binding protein EcfA2
MESQFWEILKPLLAQHPQIPSTFWEYLQNNPSLPIQLIEKTVFQKKIALGESSFFVSRISSDVSLSASQQIALKLCLANSPFMVIQGVPGSGKTRLAQVLAQGLIEQEKRILILAHHSEALSAYEMLPGIPFHLQKSQDYSIWLKEQLQQQYLGKLSMDFLPIHLLSDPLLAKLRYPQKLEKWLSILQTASCLNEITSLLQKEFPECSLVRLNLLAARLQKLFPLLKQQLWLHQQSAQLSEEVVTTLATKIEQESAFPILGTVSDLLQPQHQAFWKMTFDCVIVEEAEYLSWGELIFLAGISKKLIVLGDISNNSLLLSRKHFYSHPPLFWLGEFLLPAYRYQLDEQFRLHFSMARPILETLYDRSIHTQLRADVLTLPQLTARSQWQDVRSFSLQPENPWQGNRILKFLSELSYTRAKQVGILAFTEAQRDWLRANCPPEFKQVFIGSFTEWVGKERKILLVSCVGNPEQLTLQNLALALTRASDYLILFGDYQLWCDRSSFMQPLLERQELQREREVSLL